MAQDAITTYLETVAALENQGQGVCAFVLAHGKPWIPASFEEVSPVQFKGTPKRCFANSQQLLLRLQKKGFDFQYVEGFALSRNVPFLPIHHAWLVDQDGRVLDPTWDESELHQYFGVAFESDFIIQTIRRCGHISVVDNFQERWPLLQRDADLTCLAAPQRPAVVSP